VHSLEKKGAEMNEQTAFQLAFFIAGGQSQEVKTLTVIDC
jgi:hypothetical protein